MGLAGQTKLHVRVWQEFIHWLHSAVLLSGSGKLRPLGEKREVKNRHGNVWSWLRPLDTPLQAVMAVVDL